tara:strand:- start:2494 stop:3237 length:744 start_codon:yes stop_codon:yes gene_type:complete
MGLISAIGGLVGLAYGGPLGAALGSGIGSLASGGNIGDALKAGLMGYGLGSIPGVSGFASNAASAAGMQGLSGKFAAAQKMATQSPIGKMVGGIGQGVPAGSGLAPAAQTGTQMAQMGGIGGLNMENLILSGLIQMGEPKATPLTQLQKDQLATGERAPNYQGTPVMAARGGIIGAAAGGMISGPGTGKSDSIPAAIYQDGGRVQEARLSDGEFVMTADAVKGAGSGNRAKGAAEMYKMMNRFERRA